MNSRILILVCLLFSTLAFATEKQVIDVATAGIHQISMATTKVDGLSDWMYDIEAAISITVPELPQNSHYSTNVTVSLTGEVIMLDAESSEDLILVADLVKTAGDLSDDKLKKIAYDITLSTLPRRPLEESVKISNVSYKKGILTYDTGRIGAIVPSLSLLVKDESFWAPDQFYTTVKKDLIVSKETDAGLSHIIDLRKVFKDLKKKKYKIHMTLMIPSIDSSSGYAFFRFINVQGLIEGTATVTGK